MSLTRFIIKSFVSKVFDVNKCCTSILYEVPLLSIYSPRMDSTFGKKTIAEQLGISEPPKKPSGPFILYSIDESKKISNMKQSDKMKILGQNWRSMSESAKARYLKEYRVEAEIYEKKIKEYNKSLSPDQIQKIENLKCRGKIQKQVILTKQKLRREIEELGKPKCPGFSAISLYMKDCKYEKDYPQKRFLKQAIEKWRNLSEHEKKIYQQKFKKLQEKYVIDLYAWEIKMLEIGRRDLVRFSTLSALSAKKNQQNLNQSAGVKDKAL